MQSVSGVTSTALREVVGAFPCIAVSSAQVVDQHGFPGQVARAAVEPRWTPAESRNRISRSPR